MDSILDEGTLESHGVDDAGPIESAGITQACDAGDECDMEEPGILGDGSQNIGVVFKPENNEPDDVCSVSNDNQCETAQDMVVEDESQSNDDDEVDQDQKEEGVLEAEDQSNDDGFERVQDECIGDEFEEEQYAYCNPNSDEEHIRIDKTEENCYEEATCPAILTTASVIAMAQSAGSNLSEPVARALADLAMAKLRHAVLLANQFKRHEMSFGLTVEQFSKAESVMSTESFGHSSFFATPDFIYVGNGISILEKDKIVDLYQTFKKITENVKHETNTQQVMSLRTYELENQEFASDSEETSSSSVSEEENSDLEHNTKNSENPKAPAAVLETSEHLHEDSCSTEETEVSESSDSTFSFDSETDSSDDDERAWNGEEEDVEYFQIPNCVSDESSSPSNSEEFYDVASLAESYEDSNSTNQSSEDIDIISDNSEETDEDEESCEDTVLHQEVDERQEIPVPMHIDEQDGDRGTGNREPITVEAISGDGSVQIDSGPLTSQQLTEDITTLNKQPIIFTATGELCSSAAVPEKMIEDSSFNSPIDVALEKSSTHIQDQRSVGSVGYVSAESVDSELENSCSDSESNSSSDGGPQLDAEEESNRTTSESDSGTDDESHVLNKITTLLETESPELAGNILSEQLVSLLENILIINQEYFDDDGTEHPGDNPPSSNVLECEGEAEYHMESDQDVDSELSSDREAYVGQEIHITVSDEYLKPNVNSGIIESSHPFEDLMSNLEVCHAKLNDTASDPGTVDLNQKNSVMDLEGATSEVIRISTPKDPDSNQDAPTPMHEDENLIQEDSSSLREDADGRLDDVDSNLEATGSNDENADSIEEAEDSDEEDVLLFEEDEEDVLIDENMAEDVTELGIEWVDYMKVFISTFFSNGNKVDEEYESGLSNYHLEPSDEYDLFFEEQDEDGSGSSRTSDGDENESGDTSLNEGEGEFSNISTSEDGSDGVESPHSIDMELGEVEKEIEPEENVVRAESSTSAPPLDQYETDPNGEVVTVTAEKDRQVLEKPENEATEEGDRFTDLEKVESGNSFGYFENTMKTETCLADSNEMRTQSDLEDTQATEKVTCLEGSDAMEKSLCIEDSTNLEKDESLNDFPVDTERANCSGESEVEKMEQDEPLSDSEAREIGECNVIPTSSQEDGCLSKEGDSGDSTGDPIFEFIEVDKAGRLREPVRVNLSNPDNGRSQVLSRHIKHMKHDFERILKDIVINSVYPVFPAIISFFLDYMRSEFGNYTQAGLRRIIDVISASLKCHIPPSDYHVKRIGQTLSAMLSLPPPLEMHQQIAQTFIQIQAKTLPVTRFKVMTWVCRYISRNIIWFSTGCFHEIQSRASTFHGALCLINALEEAGITVTLDNEWHVHILDYIESSQLLHEGLVYARESKLGIKEAVQPVTTPPQMVNAEPDSINLIQMGEDSLCPIGVTRKPELSGTTERSKHSEEEDDYDWYTEDDSTGDDEPDFFSISELDGDIMQRHSLIEESIIKFLKTFLANYSKRASSELIYKVHQLAAEHYGEKMIPYLSRHQVLDPVIKRVQTEVDLNVFRELRQTRRNLRTGKIYKHNSPLAVVI